MSKQPIIATGKRKSAVASASLKPGSGKIVVNGIPLSQGTGIYVLRQREPLILAGDVAKTVDISVNVHGGGMASQADAVRLAMAKALAEHKKNLEQVFLDYDRTLLVADVRRKEPKKPNHRGKARATRQKSYR